MVLTVSIDEQLPRVRSRHWGFYIPVVAVSGIALVGSISRSIASGEPAFSMQTTGFALGFVAVVFGPYFFLRLRAIKNLSRLLAERNPGLRFVPVRSSRELRDEVSLITGKERSHRAILDANHVFVDAGSRFELWSMGRGGPERLLRLPWTVVETVEYGTVSHLEEDERAVILAGQVRGRAFKLGLPPQNIQGWFPRPAGDAAFLSFASQLETAQFAHQEPGSRTSE